MKKENIAGIIAIFVFGGDNTVQTLSKNEVYIPNVGWQTMQPIPIPRQVLFSATIENTIFN